MSQQDERKKEERKKEELYLSECIKIIENNISLYQKEIYIMNADIKDMYDRYRHDDPEIFTELSNAIVMNDNMKLSLDKNLRALNKPYFGRINIKDENREEEIFYIGKGGVMKDSITILVVDWRAPIANVYYENGLGECTYMSPNKTPITVDLRNKRTYEIANKKLIEYFDSEVVTNDELLTKYLAKNKEAVLGEIIATIQKEQNDIIRKSPYRNMIVQGVAGSGKTTVAMHRISYILYNFHKEFKAEDFYIIGSNRILLNYITGVLPELDVHGVRQMMMEDLFIRLLYEDWNEKKYRVMANSKNNLIKSKKQWFTDLEAFCLNLEKNRIPRKSIVIDGKVLYSREQITTYIEENKRISIQAKINGLNERTLNKVKNEIVGREITYTPERKKELIKAYSKIFGEKKWKQSIYELYIEFLNEQKEKYPKNQQVQEMDVTSNAFDVYDLGCLAYLYKRVKETDPIREAHHIVIDEAQDFGIMAYLALKYCIPACSYTIMGDVSQNIHFGFGLQDWEELKDLLLTDRLDTFGLLSKSYRNTVEISKFAQSILTHGTFSMYPIEPIIRHGNEVQLHKLEHTEKMNQKATSIIQEWISNGNETVAVVCRDAVESARVASELSKLIEIEESDLEKAEFKKGVMVLPVEYTKGLEFDAVLIYNPSKDSYPMEDGHAKLLYVAATRALHELAIVYTDELSSLLVK